MEVLKSQLGIDMVHIPYKSSSQSVAALLAGDIQVVLASPPGLAQGLDTGSVKMLGVLTAKRNSQYPDVPALSEFVPNYEFIAETGLLAPTGTPPEIIDKLATAAAQAVNAPDTLTRFRSLGLEPIGSTPAEYDKIIKRNLEWFREAVKISGVKVN
jgi:tripartite-type tricarboxylate transporter receptor subunit TctC